MNDRDAVQIDELSEDALPFRRRFLGSPTGRWVTAAGILVTTLAAAAEIDGHLTTEATRRALLRDQRAEAAQLTDRQRTFMSATDAFGVALATEPAGDFVDDSLRVPGALDRLFAETGVYARVPAAEVKNAFAMQSAARYSKKDGVALCLLRPTDEMPVATCGEGSMCLGNKMQSLHNLGAVNGGLRVLSPSWAAEVAGTRSALLVGGYDHELRTRDPEARDVSKRVAESARFAVVVVDETPEDALPGVRFGGVPPATATRFQGVPHAARLGIYDLTAHKPLLRLRRELSAAPSQGPEAEAVARQISSCQLGLEARALTVPSVTARADLSYR